MKSFEQPLKEPDSCCQDTKEQISDRTDHLSWHESAHYCVCFADIVDSTLLTLRIRQSERVREFYATYINTLSAIIKSFKSNIVKNTGDCLIYYFPSTSDTDDKGAFRQVLECGFSILEARTELNRVLDSLSLPEASYRVSCDYGKLEVGKFSSVQSNDLFGPTMNICAKINSMADPNSMVIGGDLYRVLRSLSIREFDFRAKGGYSFGLPTKYPVYAVSKKRNSASNNLITAMDEREHSNQFRNDATQQKLTMLEPKCDRHLIPQPHHKRPKVMIVDDEPDVLLTFKAFLHPDEFDVEIFGVPQTALQRFADCAGGINYFDLAILDIKMPGLNGLQLHQRLKRINASLKTIFVSGLDTCRELMAVIPDSRLTDIIEKPVNRETFSTRVKSILAMD